jgi:hypothetical protein
LTKASYFDELVTLLGSELLELLVVSEPHLAQEVTDIVNTYTYCKHVGCLLWNCYLDQLKLIIIYTREAELLIENTTADFFNG